MKTRTTALAILTLAAAIACTSTPNEPTPPPAQPPPNQPPPPPPGSGRLTVNLTSPNSSDGAILLELRGANIHAVALAHSGWKLFADSSGSALRIVVAGNLASGSLLTFQVPDVNAAASYSATIIDVADAQNSLRAKTGYSLGIAR